MAHLHVLPMEIRITQILFLNRVWFIQQKALKLKHLPALVTTNHVAIIMVKITEKEQEDFVSYYFKGRVVITILHVFFLQLEGWMSWGRWLWIIISVKPTDVISCLLGQTGTTESGLTLGTNPNDNPAWRQFFVLINFVFACQWCRQQFFQDHLRPFTTQQ